MVQLYIPNVESLDIPLYVRALMFLAIYIVALATMELYRRKPFLSFYLVAPISLCLTLTIYFGYETTAFVKQLNIAVNFIVISLWRISTISEDQFNAHFAGSKVNRGIYRCLKGKFNQSAVEVFVWFFFLTLNHILAVYEDIKIGSYFNAACGAVLTVTIPLPSNFGDLFGGYQMIENKSTGASELTMPDLRWPWISVFTIWNVLFTIVHEQNIWFIVFLTLPVLYPFLPFWDCQRYFMSRMVIVYMMLFTIFPWRWFSNVFGQPPLVEDPHVVVVWSAINLSLAVLSAVYYFGFLLRGKNAERRSNDQPSPSTEPTVDPAVDSAERQELL